VVNVEDSGFSITVANEFNDKADSVLVIMVDDEDVRFVENSSATVKNIDKVKKIISLLSYFGLVGIS